MIYEDPSRFLLAVVVRHLLLPADSSIYSRYFIGLCYEKAIVLLVFSSRTVFSLPSELTDVSLLYLLSTSSTTFHVLLSTAARRQPLHAWRALTRLQMCVVDTRHYLPWKYARSSTFKKRMSSRSLQTQKERNEEKRGMAGVHRLKMKTGRSGQDVSCVVFVAYGFINF